MPLRVVLVDDEPPARQKIRLLLRADRDVEIVGEAGSGREAVTVIQASKPDLVFLDIQMPDLDGFGVLAQLPEPPYAIFITAYDHHAVKAFEVQALDYLLKPVAPDRFEAVLARVKQRIAEARAAKTPVYARRLLVPEGGHTVVVPVDAIVWAEAARNYVVLHVAGATHVLRSTIEGLAKQLDPARFVRISRSVLVNVEAVREVHPDPHGDSRLVLHDGTALMWSRRYARGGRAALFMGRQAAGR